MASLCGNLLVFFTFLWLLSPGLLAAEEEFCLGCHGNKGFSTQRDGKEISLFVNPEAYSQSVHGELDCTACHSDEGIREIPHHKPPGRVDCGRCHTDEADAFRRGTHGKAFQRGTTHAPACADCHGRHDVLPAKDRRSRTFRMNIPLLCGRCHREGQPVARIYHPAEKDILDHFSQNIHGEGLFKKGLLVTATCNDCHGSHLILPQTHPESSISRQNVKRTCMRCHTRIEQLHLRVIRKELWEEKPEVIPACTTCHRPHKAIKEGLAAMPYQSECLFCHGRAAQRQRKDRLSLPPPVDYQLLAGSAHKNIPCVKCHSDVDPRRSRPCETAGRVDCSKCHARVSEDYYQSAHGQAFFHKRTDAPYCTDCHGDHAVLCRLDEESPTYRANIPKLCGDCHRRDGKAAEVSKVDKGFVIVDYSTSVHGTALKKKGLLPAAVCTDCHTAHRELGHRDPRSSISTRNIPATCGNCHRGIYRQFIRSVHSPSATEQDRRLPTCIDCHSAHEIQPVGLDEFLTEVTYQCGSCHKRLGETFLQTLHGKAYILGYLKAAKCSDCHGAHEIRRVDDPLSRVGPDRVVETCRKCHPGANRRFTGYLTHATHHDRKNHPVLYFTFLSMTGLLVVVFGFFGIHVILWLPNSFKRLKEKRRLPQSPRRYYIRRFTLFQRVMHLIVILSFTGLAITGMMLKYSIMPWAKLLADVLGGVEVAAKIHRLSAMVIIGLFCYHLFWLWRRKRTQKTPLFRFLSGENSLMFNKQDIKDFIANIKWFFGRGPRPQYGRWTYWEKFDYLAVFWGLPVIGLSGLILWFPEFLTHLMPGWIINVATIVHGDEALLAVGFIFTIHFFNTHLRPEAFPMDPVIFTGVVPLDEYRHDRPRHYQELKATGMLRKMVVKMEPSPRYTRLVYAFGFFFLLVGIITIFLIMYSMILGHKFWS